MHLSAIDVENGQYVWESNPIGKMGGSAYGKEDKWPSHLHYEIHEKKGDKWIPINPVGNKENHISNIEDPQLRIKKEDIIIDGGLLEPAVISVPYDK